MKKYFDQKNNRLVFIRQKADSEFWDSHWQIDNLKEKIEKANNNFTVKLTKKYPSGDRRTGKDRAARPYPYFLH